MNERRYHGSGQHEGAECTCYVDNCDSHLDRAQQHVSAVVECPKHSTPELRQLRQRGLRTARSFDRATAADEG